MKKKRYDQNGELLNIGELVRDDGYYMFRKMIDGERIVIYAKTLKELRQKEELFTGNNSYRTFDVREILHWISKYQCDRDKAKSYCYFIEDGSHVKIGKTNDISKRMDGLQTGNGRKLRLICAIPCKTEEAALKCEKRLHKKLSHYRQSGEWFDILYRINTLELRETIGI